MVINIVTQMLMSVKKAQVCVKAAVQILWARTLAHAQLAIVLTQMDTCAMVSD